MVGQTISHYKITDEIGLVAIGTPLLGSELKPWELLRPLTGPVSLAPEGGYTR